MTEVTDATMSRGDLQTVRRLLPSLAPIAEEHEALCDQHELHELLDDHGSRMLELDPATLPDYLKDQLLGWYAKVQGTPVLIFPLGQDPAVRLQVAHQLLASAEGA